jgi:hypothetical protein
VRRKIVERLRELVDSQLTRRKPGCVEQRRQLVG